MSNKNDQKKKRQMSLYLSMRTMGLPCTIFVCSLFFVLSDRGGWGFLIFIFTWLIEKESTMFWAMKTYRLRSLLFYSGLVILTIITLYTQLYFLAFLHFFLIIYWAYSSAIIYVDDFLSEESRE